MRTADRCHGGFVLLHPKPSGLPRRPDYASISLHAGTENHPLGNAPRDTRAHGTSLLLLPPIPYGLFKKKSRLPSADSAY